MASSVELAVGYITLAAETSQISKSIGTMFKGADKHAGVAGRSMGKALKDNFEKANSVDLDGLRKEVETGEAKITAAIERGSDAQKKARRSVEIAEAELQEKRESGRASVSQIMKAEDKLTLARQKSEAATVAAKSDVEKYNKELAESKTALQAAERAAESAAKGTSSAFSGIGAKIKKGLSGDLSGAFDGVAKRADFVSGRVKEEFGVTSEAIGAALKGDFRNAFQTLSDQGASASRRLKGDLSTAFSGVRPDAAKAADAAEREFKDAGEDAGRGFSTGFKDKLKGALAGAVAYMGISELSQGIGAAVTGAGDLEQSIGAIDSVFKDSAGQMTAWSLNASTAVGLSRNEFNELGTLIGAQLKNGGTAMDELAPKTNQLIELGADLSSMFGGSTKESVEALSSALKGERDPIERYGVSLNQAKIEAEAASLGFSKVGKSFEDEAIQAATLSLIMKQTADAHGNFARESDTFAHKQQVMAAQWADLKTKIGELFMPALSHAMGFIGGTALPAITEFTGGLRAFGAAWAANNGDITSSGFAGHMERLAFTLRGVHDAITPVGAWLDEHKGTWGPFAAGIGLVAGAYGAWTLATKIQTAALWGQAAAFIAANAPIVAVVAGIGLLVGAVIWAYKNVEVFRNIVNGAWSFIKSVTASLVSWFAGTAFPAIVNAVRVVGNVFSWLNTNVVQPVWSRIRSAISAVANWFTGTIVPNFNKSITALGKFFDFLYRNFIAPFVFAFKLIINTTLAWFRSTIVPAFKAALNVLGAAFRYLYDKVIKPVFDWIRSKIRAVFDWFNVERAKLQGRLRILGDAFKALYNGAVKPAFDWIRTKASAVWGALRDHVFAPMRSGLDRLQDAFRAAKDGIGQTWDKLKAKVKEPIAFVVNKVINPFIGGYNKLNDFWSGTDLKKIKGFHAGGYTGPGSKYKPAGVVHADEYVIRKESQNDLSRNAPGLLDNLNKYGSKALGYHTGGLVAGRKHDDPANMAIGARVYGGVQSFTGPMFEAIRNTGELNVSGSVPGWGLDAAIRMADAATTIKVQRGSTKKMNGVTAYAATYPAPWDGYYQGDDRSIMLNQARNHNPFVRRAITAHELGHALALPHNALRHGGNGAQSIMNYDNFYKHGTYTSADVAALSAIYGGSGKAGVNGGSGDGGGIGEWIAEKLKKIATAPIDAAKGAFKGNRFVEMPLGMAEKFITDAIDFAVGGSDSGGPAGEKQVAKWMTQALKMKGMYSETNLQSGIARAMKESGGDPSITQGVDDVNSRSGNHARGLMQVIPPTFNAFKEPGYDDIFNPIDNILASINYTVKRYGTLAAGWNQPGGYANGGLVKPGNVWDDPVGTVHKLPQGVSSIYNGTGGAEYFQRVDPNGGSSGPKYHIENFNALDTDDALRKLRRHELRREALAYVA